jgi:hypothetical protein
LAITYTARKSLVVARANRILLTTTATTAIMTVTPQRTSLLEVSTYFSVITASTNVTITLSYTDPDAGAISYPILALTSEPVGAHPQPSVLILARGGTQVQLLFTAGTANQVTASGAITDNT